MKIQISEPKFLFILLFISFSIRIVLAPFFKVPHDQYAYINAGEAMINGTWYATISSNLTEFRNYSTYPGPYGPLLGLTYAPFLKFFGRDYFILKLPSILFDTLSILIVYYITKNIKGPEAARVASIFYSFTYVILISVAAHGKDNGYQLFWLLLSVYLLIKSKYTLSGLSLGIGGGYVFIPLVALLPILYYIYNIEGLKKSIMYTISVFATLFIILFPFYINVGMNALHPYLGPWIQLNGWPKPTHPIDGMSLSHLISMTYYFISTNAGIPYNQYSPPEIISVFSTVVGAILILGYIYKYRLNDRKIELTRNIFIIFSFGLIFAKEFYFMQLVWLVPFAMILAVRNTKTNNTFILNFKELFGIILILLGASIHTIIYQEYTSYSIIENLIIIIGVLLVFTGTFLKLSNTDISFSWAMVMFVGSAFYIMDARPLELLGNFISLFQIPRYVWGVHYYMTIVVMLIAMLFLIKNIHAITYNNLIEK